MYFSSVAAATAYLNEKKFEGEHLEFNISSVSLQEIIDLRHALKDSKVRNIFLQGGDFNREIMIEIGKIVYNNSIKNFNFSQNNFDVDSLKILKKIILNPSLIQFGLTQQQQQLTDENLIGLITSFSESMAVKELVLQGTNISNEVLQVILSQASFINILDLAACSLLLNSMQYFKEKKDYSVLNWLDLGFNDLHQQKDIEDIAEFLKYSALGAFVFSGNNIGDIGAEIFSKNLGHYLISLHLGFNEIGNLGAIKLAQAIRESSTLRELNLTNNKIAVEGAYELSDAIEINSTLTSLNFAINNFGSDGVIYLAKKIKDKAISSLKLDNNKVDENGSKIFFEIMCAHKFLIELSFGHNNLKNAGGRALAKMIQQTNALVSLNVSNNMICDAAAKEIFSAIQINTSLESLDIHHQKFLLTKEMIENLKNNFYLIRLIYRNLNGSSSYIFSMDMINEDLEILDREREEKTIIDNLLKRNTVAKQINNALQAVEKIWDLEETLFAYQKIVEKLLEIDPSPLTTQLINHFYLSIATKYYAHGQFEEAAAYLYQAQFVLPEAKLILMEWILAHPSPLLNNDRLCDLQLLWYLFEDLPDNLKVKFPVVNVVREFNLRFTGKNMDDEKNIKEFGCSERNEEENKTNLFRTLNTICHADEKDGTVAIYSPTFFQSGISFWSIKSTILPETIEKNEMNFSK